ncbi:MAG: hypothetical protein V3V01_04225 [Acidimicrobiales bacterium]
MATVGQRRTVFFFFAIGFALMVTVLSLSDSAPGALRTIRTALAPYAHQIAAVFDLDRPTVPFEQDQIGHAAIWGFGMFGIGLGLRRRIWLPIIATAMIAISAVFELLQGEVTASRSVSLSDGYGNIAGIAAATLLVAVLGPIADWWLNRNEALLA